MLEEMEWYVKAELAFDSSGVAVGSHTEGGFQVDLKTADNEQDMRPGRSMYLQMLRREILASVQKISQDRVI